MPKHAPLRDWTPRGESDPAVLDAMDDRLAAFAPVAGALTALTCWFYLVQLLFDWPLAMGLEAFDGVPGIFASVVGDRIGWLVPDTAARREWHRLWTSTLLHHSVLHVAGNALVTYAVGRLVEHILGARAVVTVWSVAAALGSLFTLLQPEGWSLGASGAACGLLGAAVAAGRRLRHRLPHEIEDQLGVDLQAFVVLVLLFSFVPGVNWVAHVVGLLTGAAIAWFWPMSFPEERSPGLGAGRWMVTGLAAAPYLVSVGIAGSHLPTLGEQVPVVEVRRALLAVDAKDEPAFDAALADLRARVPTCEHWDLAEFQLALHAKRWDQASAALQHYEREHRRAARRFESLDNDLAWTEMLSAPDDKERVRAAFDRAKRAIDDEPGSIFIRNTWAYALVLVGREREGLEEARANIEAARRQVAPQAFVAKLLSGEEIEADISSDTLVEVIALVRLQRLAEARARFDFANARWPEAELLDRAQQVLVAAEAKARPPNPGSGAVDAPSGEPVPTTAPPVDAPQAGSPPAP